MSGGSWGYMYRVDLTEFNNGMGYHTSVKRIREAAERFAKEDQSTIAEVLNCIVRDIENAQKAWLTLEDPLHALEWWDSGDYGKDQFEEACREYLEKTEGPPNHLGEGI